MVTAAVATVAAVSVVLLLPTPRIQPSGRRSSSRLLRASAALR